MPTFRDKAIVLKTRPLRGADRQYIVFTERHGKLSLIGRGTRPSKSKMSPHMGSFGIAEVMVARGRRADRLAGAGLLKPFISLTASFEKAAYTQAFLLTLDSLTKRELPEERIFRLAADALEAFDSPRATTRAMVSQAFDAAIAQLLIILGIGPEIDACVRCRRPLEERPHRFHAGRGGVECPRCASSEGSPISAHAIKAIRYYRTTSVKASLLLRLPPNVGGELSRLTETLLSEHIEDRFAALHFLKAVF